MLRIKEEAEKVSFVDNGSLRLLYANGRLDEVKQIRSRRRRLKLTRFVSPTAN